MDNELIQHPAHADDTPPSGFLPHTEPAECASRRYSPRVLSQACGRRLPHRTSLSTSSFLPQAQPLFSVHHSALFPASLPSHNDSFDAGPTAKNARYFRAPRPPSPLRPPIPPSPRHSHPTLRLIRRFALSFSHSMLSVRCSRLNVPLHSLLITAHVQRPTSHIPLTESRGASDNTRQTAAEYRYRSQS